MKRIAISEEQIIDAVISVINENRKVLKVGNSQPAPSAPQDMAPMPQSMPTDFPPADANMPPEDMGQGMPPEGGEENQFDNDFDAGVEADEETDPKRYIQQLTGKLSQSLNSFNEENGPDAGLSKYVASMIIAAAAKNLDEKAKKELIEKINSASGDEETEEPEMDVENAPEEEPPMEEQPLQESVLTKRKLKEMGFGVTKGREPSVKKLKPGQKNIFGGKSF